jgi:hypothetical protein
MTSDNTETGVGHVETEKPVFDTPGVGELQDVDDATAQQHLAQVGTEARQPDDHPYDAEKDPDSGYTQREREDSRLGKVAPSGDGRHFDALRAQGKDAMALDPGMPAAAPRAGG